MLQPSESQRVTITFFGHANLVARVTALCEVEGGPTYEVALRGEASLLSYLFDIREIDCRLQVPQLLLEAITGVLLPNNAKDFPSFPAPGTGGGLPLPSSQPSSACWKDSLCVIYLASRLLFLWPSPAP